MPRMKHVLTPVTIRSHRNDERSPSKLTFDFAKKVYIRCGSQGSPGSKELSGAKGKAAQRLRLRTVGA